MAQKKITDLTLRTDFDETCNIPVDDTSQTWRATGQQLLNFSRNLEWGGSAGGTADVLTLTPGRVLAAYVSGAKFNFLATATNTTAATLNISGLGAQAIKTQNGSALTAGCIVSGKMYTAVYDGTNFRLFSFDQMAANSIKGNNTGSSGVPLDLTAAQVRAMLAQSSSFLARPSANQTISHNTFTKLQFATEVYDYGGYYDNATNYRFTPLIAGRYFVHTQVVWLSPGATGFQTMLSIYKNGSGHINQFAEHPPFNTEEGWGVCGLVDMNGTTDYLEAYVFHFKGSNMDTYSSGDNIVFGAGLISG